MKIIKTCFVSLILLSFLTACQTGGQVKETVVEKYPGEVENLTLPDGWSDHALLKIEEEDEVTKPIMAIVDFESNVDLDLNIYDLGLTDLLTNAMFKTGKFDLVERNKLDSVFKEQNLANSDDFEEADAARIGELLGADYILTGKISTAVRDIADKYSHYELTALLTLNLRAIDTSTGKIYKSVEAVGSDTALLVVDDRGNVIKGPAELRTAVVESKGGKYLLSGVNMSKQFVGAAKKAIKQLSNKLEANFPLIGYVIKGDETKIMTDIGASIGAKRGDYFIIVRLGDDIIHPRTKKVLGKEKIVIGSAIIESVGEKESHAKIIKLKSTDNLPKSGDVVISISRKYESLSK